MQATGHPLACHTQPGTHLHEVDGLEGVGLDGQRAVLEEQGADDARVVRLNGQDGGRRAQVGRAGDQGRRAAVLRGTRGEHLMSLDCLTEHITLPECSCWAASAGRAGPMRVVRSSCSCSDMRPAFSTPRWCDSKLPVVHGHALTLNP